MTDPAPCHCGSISWERPSDENRYTCCSCKRPLWQPIDTAPKDGTIVLGYFDNDDETFFMSEIMWIKSDEWFIGSASAPLGPSQWFSLLRQGIVIPTHWMPLPAPPKMEKKND